MARGLARPVFGGCTLGIFRGRLDSLLWQDTGFISGFDLKDEIGPSAA